MFGALAYLEWHTRCNQLRARLRRLRQPKYLFGAIVGGAYFYFYFFRFLGQRGGSGGTGAALSPGHHELAEALVAIGLLVWMLLTWIIPRERAALNFTEAEVAFLFPAPVGRRVLINYKLLKSQFALLLSALFVALFRSWGGGHFLGRAIAWWGVLAVLNLHTLGSSFARTMLLDRGISNWQRRALFLGVLGLGLLGIALWARQTLPPPPAFGSGSNLDAWSAYASRLLQAGPVPWVLLPFRLVAAPIFARGAGQLCLAMIPVLLIIALHYCWVIWSNVAFEEASVEMSRKFAEMMAAAKEGNLQRWRRPKKAKAPPFKLKPEGWAGAAIGWKNLISAGYSFTGRAWLWLAWMAIVIGLVVQHTLARSQAGVLGSILGTTALGLVAMSLVSGPQMLRHDFRQDLRVADMLKSYPVPAWQVVLGELLAPAAILIVAQWLALLAAMVFFNRLPNGMEIPLSSRLGIALAAALLLPFVDVIALILPNAAALIFPAWVQLGKNAPRGMETMGQQIILMAGQIILLALALLPAGLVFALTYWVGARFLGLVPGVMMGAAAAAAVLGAVAALGVTMLARAFERFDWSEGAPEQTGGG